MARSKRRGASEDKPLSADEQWVFDNHLRTLSIAGAEAYFSWCKLHRLPPEARKTGVQRRREFDVRMKERSDLALEKLRKTSRNPAKMIERIFEDAKSADELSGP